VYRDHEHDTVGWPLGVLLAHPNVNVCTGRAVVEVVEVDVGAGGVVVVVGAGSGADVGTGGSGSAGRVVVVERSTTVPPEPEPAPPLGDVVGVDGMVVGATAPPGS